MTSSTSKPKSSIEITPATADEMAMVCEFARRTFLQTYTGLIKDNFLAQYMDVHMIGASFATQFENPDSYFYCVRDTMGAKIIGYLKLNQGDAQNNQSLVNGMEIERIYADRSAQGKGIGRAMVEFSIQQARDNHADWLWLGVWDENHKAIGFYEKCGFEKFSQHDFQMGDELQTDFLMRRKI